MPAHDWKACFYVPWQCLSTSSTVYPPSRWPKMISLLIFRTDMVMDEQARLANIQPDVQDNRGKLSVEEQVWIVFSHRHNPPTLV